MFRGLKESLEVVALVGCVIFCGCDVAASTQFLPAKQSFVSALPNPKNIKWDAINDFQERENRGLEAAQRLANSVDLSNYSGALEQGMNAHFEELITLLEKMPDELGNAGFLPPDRYKEILGKRVLEWFRESITDQGDLIKKSTLICYSVNVCDVFDSNNVFFPDSVFRKKLLPEKNDSLFLEYVFPYVVQKTEYKPRMKNGVDRRLIDFWKEAADFASQSTNKYLLDLINDLYESMYCKGLLLRPE